MESLSSLLADLHDLDLTGEIQDEDPFLTAHGGYCDVFRGKARRHGGMQVAIKRLRVHVLESKEAAKVLYPGQHPFFVITLVLTSNF